jgi:gliding motility-associated-like protein
MKGICLFLYLNMTLPGKWLSGTVGLLLFLLPGGLLAQFQANGSAVATGGNCFELTPDATGQGGSIWYLQKFNLHQFFDVKFSINLGCKGYSTGADGIGFVFQPLSTNAGSLGGGMGFGGISPSLDVEFDTYQNGWDPGYCHIVIEQNGDVVHSTAADLLAGPVPTSPTGAGLPDCTSHPGRITWNPLTKTLSVYFDCSLRLTYTGDIVNTIFSGNPLVYWGFTAGTGGASNYQGVCIENSYLNNLRDTTICAGDPVQLTKSGGVTYSWTPAAGLSSAAVANPVATPVVTTNYFVTVTDSCGYQSKDSVLITVRSVHDTITGVTNILCNGASTGSATAAMIGGTSPYTYSWSNGDLAATATALAATAYTVQVTDTYGCKSSTSVTPTQPAALTLSVSGIAATCKGLCNGQLICIPAGGVSPYSYSWAGGCSSASCNNVCAGTYSLTVNDANACITTANVAVTEPAAALSLMMGAVSSHCKQADGVDSVVVAGGSPAYSYSWSPGGATTSTNSNLVPGAYKVVVTDSHHCTLADSLNVQNIPGLTASITATVPVSCFMGTNGGATAAATGASGAVTYAWSPSGGNSASASMLATGNYTCQITDAVGCRDQAIALVTQPPLLTVATMAPVTICITQSAALTANGAGGTPAYTYSWSSPAGPVTSIVSPPVTTSYNVICTDANGCNSSVQIVTITVRPPVHVTVSGTDSVCPGASAQLTATGNGGDGVYTYSWSPPAGLNNATLSNPLATPLVTTTYTVHVNDGCGTPPDSNTVKVVLYPVTVPVFSTLDTAGCAPFCVTYYDASVPACSSASWVFGDGSTGSGCDSSKHCYSTAGTFSCKITVTDIHGCKGSSTRTNYIHVHPLPIARFTASPQPTTILNPKINFQDTSIGAVSQAWSFSELPGATDSILNPHYTFPDTGCYPVMLAVKSIFGCVDTSRSPICISPYFTFYIPDAFTPDADGRNDVWLPRSEDADPNHYEVSVFDRWGNRVFYTTTWGKGWDGRASGGSDIAQIDTYVYQIFVRDFKGNKYTYRGIVNLVK